MVKVDKLSFVYPDGHQALHAVSFHIETGETVGLIGPNGAGKSTLLMHLNGLLGLSKRNGRIWIHELEITSSNLPEIRRRVGLLFQDPDDQLFNATVGEDVAFGPMQLGLSDNEVQQRVKEALAAVKLVGFENRPPHHLSIGERKRVCLAGVWACRPDVLVFDEPTANFDPRGRREFIELCRSFRATKLIASHDLEMILALCSKVVILDAGQIIAHGESRQILGNKTLMETHGLESPHSLRPHAHQHDIPLPHAG